MATTINQRETFGAVKEQARDLAQEASDFAGQAKEKVQQCATTALNKVRDTAQQVGSATAAIAGEAKDKVQEYAHVAADKAADLSQDVTNLVRRNPIASILIAVGIGFMIGRQLRS